MPLDYEIIEALDIHLGEYWSYVNVIPLFDISICTVGYF